MINKPNWFAPMAAPTNFSPFGTNIYGQQSNELFNPLQNQTSSKSFRFDPLQTQSVFSPVLDILSNLQKVKPQNFQEPNINKNLYTSQQDLYGNQYYQDGGQIQSQIDDYEDLKKALPYIDEDNEMDYLYPVIDSELKALSSKKQTLESLLQEEMIKDENNKREKAYKEMLLKFEQNQEATYPMFRNKMDFDNNFDDYDAENDYSNYYPYSSYSQSTSSLKPLSQQKQIIAETARKYNLPPQILYGIFGAESNFGKHPTQVSSAGAQGPFQFMPETAKQYKINPWDFNQAADGAARYIANEYKRFGNYQDAVAAYNAGPGRVIDYKKGKSQLPKETRDYVPKVFQLGKTF